jgi:hypothetical protein
MEPWILIMPKLQQNSPNTSISASNSKDGKFMRYRQSYQGFEIVDWSDGKSLFVKKGDNINDKKLHLFMCAKQALVKYWTISSASMDDFL